MRVETEEKTRETFESWALSGSRFFPIDKAINGDYFNTLTNETWKAWKAALARYGLAHE